MLMMCHILVMPIQQLLVIFFQDFYKLKGEDTYFLTGTDEHGQKVEKAALTQNKNTQKFVDEMSKNFRDLIPYLGCEIDDFIRTTENRHKKAAQFLWNKVKKK